MPLLEDVATCLIAHSRIQTLSWFLSLSFSILLSLSTERVSKTTAHAFILSLQYEA